jgi:oligopeptide/dipeptide ABC transporter ATP-binding protein
MSALLEVEDLRVTFRRRGGEQRAVDGLSYRLAPGETLGVVGESGSGKSVAHLAILGLLPDTARVEAAALRFAGRDLLSASSEERRRLRGRALGIVFQDPGSSLNPLMSVGAQLAEVLEEHENATRRAARARAAAALAEVGIADPTARLDAYPHELSGGMRQRVMIAMALLLRPRLLVLDEPTTALDVTIQAQIVELLQDLRARHGTAIAFITHSLGLVAGFADSVLVMYAGRAVEAARTDELYARPLHPYTRGLLASVPRLDGDLTRPLAAIPGAPPGQPLSIEGCAFAPRCALAEERCRRAVPPLRAHEPGHAVACVRAGEELP